jgi:hypothetical protein
MSPVVYIAAALLLVVAVALTGTAPKGAKSIGHTRLMTTARAILIGGIIAFGVIGLLTLKR